jgi:hypothetical protein
MELAMSHENAIGLLELVRDALDLRHVRRKKIRETINYLIEVIENPSGYIDDLNQERKDRGMEPFND